MSRITTHRPMPLNRPPRRYQGDPVAQALSMWGAARRAATARRAAPAPPLIAPRPVSDPEITLPLFIPTRPPGTPEAVL